MSFVLAQATYFFFGMYFDKIAPPLINQNRVIFHAYIISSKISSMSSTFEFTIIVNS
jgi:hypothetical protein